MLDFSTLQGLTIPQGNVTAIERDGVKLWAANIWSYEWDIKNGAYDSLGENVTTSFKTIDVSTSFEFKTTGFVYPKSGYSSGSFYITTNLSSAKMREMEINFNASIPSGNYNSIIIYMREEQGNTGSYITLYSDSIGIYSLNDDIYTVQKTYAISKIPETIRIKRTSANIHMIYADNVLIHTYSGTLLNSSNSFYANGNPARLEVNGSTSLTITSFKFRYE